MATAASPVDRMPFPAHTLGGEPAELTADPTACAGVPYQALAVAYSPDGSRIAVRSQDETIRLWSARMRRC